MSRPRIDLRETTKSVRTDLDGHDLGRGMAILRLFLGGLIVILLGGIYVGHLLYSGIDRAAEVRASKAEQMALEQMTLGMRP
jgi:hypothetical protein